MRSSPKPLPHWVPTGHPARVLLGRHAGRFRWGISYGLLDTHPNVREWEERLGVTLIGIGELQHGYIELYLASDGRYFGMETVAGEFFYYGDTFRQFLFTKVFRKARPLFRPGVERILWYGEPLMRDDPRVYAWHASGGEGPNGIGGDS